MTRLRALCSFVSSVLLSTAFAPGCEPIEDPPADPDTSPTGVPDTSEAEGDAARTRIDLAGRVIDGYGQPLAGAIVAVDGATTTADGDGRFTLGGVAAPYDILVATDDGFFAVAYLSVTRADPTLTVPMGTDPIDTSIDGELAGDVDDDGANRASIIAVGEGFGFTGLRNATADWKRFGPLFAKHWQVPAEVRLYALQWQVATPEVVSHLPAPTTFSAFGISSPLELDGEPTAMSVSLSSAAILGTGRIRGTVTLPAGYTLGFKQHWVSFAPNADMVFYFDDSPDLAIDVNTPRLGAVAGDPRFGLEVAASGPAGATAWVARTGLAYDATGLTVAVPPPPTDLAAAAAGVFGWTPTSPVSLVGLRPSEAVGPTLWVVTGADTCTWPDFSAVGIDIAPGRGYRFGVAAMSGLADVEEATAAGGIADPWVRFTLGMRAERDGGLSFSDEVVFVTPR